MILPLGVRTIGLRAGINIAAESHLWTTGANAVRLVIPITGDSPSPCSSSSGSRFPMVNESGSPAGFPTTRWSQVAHAVNSAAPEARAALAELCEAYWFPLYAYIRRNGNGPEQALDLTQGYFAPPA